MRSFVSSEKKSASGVFREPENKKEISYQVHPSSILFIDNISLVNIRDSDLIFEVFVENSCRDNTLGIALSVKRRDVIY